MKTKIKRHSRTVLSIVLTLCMLVSCMTVGMIATDAAKTAEERVGAGVQTYNVTLQADSPTYGSLTATYVNESGSSVTTQSITNSTNITVKQDTVVTLTATAGDSGNFDGWSVVSGTYTRSSSTPLSAATVNIKPTSDLSMKANFSQIVTTTTAFYTDIWTGSTSVSKEPMKQYPGSSYDGRTDLLKATVTLEAGKNYNIQFKYNNTKVLGVQSANQSATSWRWYQNWNNNPTKFKPSKTGTYTILAELNGDRTNEIQAILLEGDVNIISSSGGSDDTPSTTGYTNLYVLDGIITRKNNAIQTFGTNTFGDSKIISSNSGVLKLNYYDAEDGNEFIFSNDTHSEGQRIYWYNAAENLDFRVQTTIKDRHQAIGVRAFVMNGMTYPAKMSANGVYYADITLDADSNQGVLEVIPVYYNKLIEAEGDYIKFYVDANTIGNKFGKTIGYSAWFNDKGNDGGETGGYPGQPLLSDGTLLYGYLPKYYVDNNATSIPTGGRKAFAGVLLSNLAEHNETHKDVLRAWGCSTANYQSFDYKDPVQIANNNAGVDTIEFVAKYKELDPTHRYDSSYRSRELNGKTGKNWPASITRPTSAATALSNGFEYLTNIDGKRVNIFNDTGTLTGDPLYVVSVGNQKIPGNDWATVWVVYTSSGTNIVAAPPVDFINPSSALRAALQSYTNSPVLINYEGWLPGESNTGTRLDGRWLYSKSTDATTLRLRVAKEDANGNLTFMTDGITWAEINDGTHNGALEAADTSNLTKILELGNRTTEVTAKINPVGYTVEGMYMLGAAYSDDANNGYSTKISDYDNMNVTGTATSFVNSKDNRMVIVVKEIPETDLVITHQMYGGPGAHKIKGFYYVKAELLDSSGNTVKNYNDGNYKANSLTLTNFTEDAPKNDGYKLKVTIQTRMSGSASFNKWYENDHNNGYNEIDSTDAHGSTDPVEKEIIVDVDSLYGENYLRINNLDYYSDLQAAGSVNINHLLLPETISAGLSGTAYTQVTVVNSSGNAVSGGSYAAKARTTEVGSDFITTDNANNGCKLKVEIWTIPDSPAEFDKFYKDTTTEMTTSTDSSNNISYTIDQTKIFNDTEYTAATVMIPIRYFFKAVLDEDGQTNVLQFDSTKQNFDLYSSLKIGYKYSLHFDFQGYRNLYGNLGYDVAETEFTAKELEDYFVLANDVIDTNNNTVTAYKFKNDDARNAFINLKAPYENTFMETVKWQTDMYGQDHPEGMTATYSSSEHKWSFVVKLKKTDDRYAFVTLRFPYAVKNYDPDKHAPQTSTVTIDGQSTNAVVKLTNDEYNEYGGRSTTTTNYRTGYGSNYFISGSYLTAAQKIWNTADNCWEYFDYWKVEKDGDSKTGSGEYTRCYYPEFNLSLYQDSILTPIYTPRAEGMTPSQRAAADDTARTDTYSTGGRATINMMENSRMQWTTGRSGNTLSGTYVNGGDRIYTDFLVSYTYGDKQLNTETTAMKAGIVIETVRDLDMEDGEYVTKTQAEYKTSDDSTINKADIKAFIEGGANSALLKDEFSVTTLDNKNRKNHYYSLPNISQTNHNPTERKNKLYRAYSYLKDANGTTLLISDPIYFTIYDIASIENMSAGATYGGVS